MTEQIRDAKVQLIEAICSCGDPYTVAEETIAFDDNGTLSKLDDTVYYVYTCSACGEVFESPIRYPYTKFIGL